MFADDKTRQLRPLTLDVFSIQAVVTDMWVSLRDELTTLAGLRVEFLVAGHRGVEAHISVDFAIRTNGSAGEYGTVFQDQFCCDRHCVEKVYPSARVPCRGS